MLESTSLWKWTALWNGSIAAKGENNGQIGAEYVNYWLNTEQNPDCERQQILSL